MYSKINIHFAPIDRGENFYTPPTGCNAFAPTEGVNDLALAAERRPGPLTGMALAMVATTADPGQRDEETAFTTARLSPPLWEKDCWHYYGASGKWTSDGSIDLDRQRRAVDNGMAFAIAGVGGGHEGHALVAPMFGSARVTFEEGHFFEEVDVWATSTTDGETRRVLESPATGKHDPEILLAHRILFADGSLDGGDECVPALETEGILLLEGGSLWFFDGGGYAPLGWAAELWATICGEVAA